MEDQATYELIEKYLNQELSEKDQADFEKRLKAEPDFAAEVSEIRALHQLVELSGDQLAKVQIEKAATAYASQRLINRRRLLIVSLVAAIAVLVLIFYPRNEKQLPLEEDLFAENFSLFRAPSQARSNDSLVDWTKIRTNYEAGNFANVITSLNQLDLNDSSYQEYFYLGISYLALESPDGKSAILSFEKVLLTDNDYVEITEWYLGLAYLANQNPEKAQTHFQTLIEKGNSYRREEILDLLEKIK